VYLARRHDFALRAAQGRVVKQAFLLFPSINENVSRLASGARTMLAAHDGTGRSCRLKLASARCLLNHQTTDAVIVTTCCFMVGESQTTSSALPELGFDGGPRRIAVRLNVASRIWLVLSGEEWSRARKLVEVS
jgi:hypothetical protein